MRSRLGGVLIVACAILLGAGCGGGGRLGAKGLAERSSAVQSLAAEGALLAEDSFAGKSTGTYWREHSADLAAAASRAAASLETATTTPGLRPELRALGLLAARVHGDLERLKNASKAEQRALGRALEADAKQSERIGSELG